MIDSPEYSFWLVARDKPELLAHVMRYLAGGARISFEGDLSRCGFPATLSRSSDADPILKRQNVSPGQDFVILPLEHDTIGVIQDVVLAGGHYRNDIHHVQIERCGELQFGCYDQPHRGCMVCFLGAPTKVLDELQQMGILMPWTKPGAPRLPVQP